MTAPKNIAAHADSTGAADTNEPQTDLDSMLEGLLKNTPKLNQPGANADEDDHIRLGETEPRETPPPQTTVHPAEQQVVKWREPTVVGRYGNIGRGGGT